jgi:hypothetical protein
LDGRRTISSNQYAVLPSQDTAPIDEVTSATTSSIVLLDEAGPFVYQGYHSLINGSYVNNDYYKRTFFLDNIITNGPSGPWVVDEDSIENNVLELTYLDGQLNLYKRASWYGSSIHSDRPSDGAGDYSSINEYVRSAGMMERDRITEYSDGDSTYINRGDELIFFTASNAIEPAHGDGLTEYVYGTGVPGNTLQSKPVVFMSSSRNVGITTTPLSDIGVMEPLARLQVHAKKGLLNERGVSARVTGYNPISGSPEDYFRVGAFTSESIDGFGSHGGYTLVKIGRVESKANQNDGSIWTDYTKIPQGGIRFESYESENNDTLSNTGSLQFGIGLGKQPNYEINSNEDNFLTEWVLSVSPIATGQALTQADHSDRNKYVAGVGIQERFPRARFHMYGANEYRTLNTGDANDPYGLYGRITYTGATGPNANTANPRAARQIAIDYVNSQWRVSAGILDYRYDPINNMVNYPFVEGLQPRIKYGNATEDSYDRWKTFTGPATSNDGWKKAGGVWFPFPGATPQPSGVGPTTHGGEFNAWFPTQNYQGFNLIRDLSYDGDDRDLTTWSTGTDGVSNAATAILSDDMGNLGLVSIPRWRDGGRAAGMYEQRNLGNREVLNAIKFYFDSTGNIGVGNKPGYDPSAYPSQFRSSTNEIWYVRNQFASPPAAPNFALVTYTGPSTPRLTAGGTNYGGHFVGKTLYNVVNFNGPYDAGTINSLTPGSDEMIRAEFGADKLFFAPGGIIQNRGWGYPVNRAADLDLKYTVSNSTGAYSGTLRAQTDAEGRMVAIFFKIADITPIITALGGGPINNADNILIQHPTELIGVPAYTAPIGAVSPGIDFITFNSAGTASVSWSKLNGGRITPANIRLNNFVAGEGERTVRTTTSSTPATYTLAAQTADTTDTTTQAIRRTSPKIILTFEGVDEDRTGVIIKASTVIRSNQNVTSLRNYWIPKTDNTGGTFMAFTSHFEKTANDDSIDKTSIKKERLNLEEVTYIAIDAWRGGNIEQPNAQAKVVGSLQWNNASPSTQPLAVLSGYTTINYPYDTATLPGSNFTTASYTVQPGDYNIFKVVLNNRLNFSWTGLTGSFNTANNLCEVIVKKNGTPVWTRGYRASDFGLVATQPTSGSSAPIQTVDVVSVYAVAGDIIEIDLAIAKRATAITGSVGSVSLNVLRAATGAAGSNALIINYINSYLPAFHPQYIKYDYNYAPPSYTFPAGQNATPDAINWLIPGWDNPSGKYYDVNGIGDYHKPVFLPLRQRADGLTAPNTNARGYKNIVEIVKTSDIDPRYTPTQIRFRRINSEWAILDYNITLKVNDGFDLELGNWNAAGATPSANSMDTGFAAAATRRGMWWLHQGKIRFDIDSGMIQATTSSSQVTTDDYHRIKYGNGMGFRMWSDYNQWYQGTAVAHQGIPNAIGYAPEISTTNRYNKTFNHNSWNWLTFINEYLNGSNPLIPAIKEFCSFKFGPTMFPGAAAEVWVTDINLGSLSTSQSDLAYTSYDREINLNIEYQFSEGGSSITASLESGYATNVYATVQEIVLPIANPNDMPNKLTATFIVPAGCRFRIKCQDTGGTDPDYEGWTSVFVGVRRIGEFDHKYHAFVRNTGISWGLSSNTGVLLPFAQALRNRVGFNGSWNDIYDEGDGYWGDSSTNLTNFMRQIWTTFGNGAFMKSKPIQWRVTPYNDPGNRYGGYEWTGPLTPIYQNLPLGNEGGGPFQDGFENSFNLEFIIPDGILHDPVGGFGKWGDDTYTSPGTGADGIQNPTTGLQQSREFRYVTISGQAMVNFQENTQSTTWTGPIEREFFEGGAVIIVPEGPK